MITVFTATYNRAYIIETLYTSLLQQTFKNFEWLVVDDGSSDGTEGLIRSFIQEEKISIRYIKQENGGKHRAVNRGAQEAKGELFFIVDSDDFLVENALERIEFHWLNICSDATFAGVCGLKVYPDGSKVGGESDFGLLDCNLFDFRYRYKVKGDMAEVVKTSVLRKYPFNDIEGEKFCAESLVWNRLSTKYKLRYFQEGIYVCDYLPDGLSAASVRNRIKCPQYATLIYSELSKLNVPLSVKIRACINYWRFAFYRQGTFRSKIREIGWISLILIPVSVMFFVTDARR